MFKVIRPDREIEDLKNACDDAENDGRSKFPGMTYEQGIAYVLRWLENAEDSHPLEE